MVYCTETLTTEWVSALSSLPGLCTPALGVKYGPIIQVCKGGYGRDDDLAVVTQIADGRVALEVQTAKIRELLQHVQDLHKSRAFGDVLAALCLAAIVPLYP